MHSKLVPFVPAVLGAALASAALAYSAAAETWDMPMAYADSNYHSQTGKAFGQCVTTGTGGAIEIVVHTSGSLFKGNEIKRAVQTGQAPIGERLLSAHANENALFGIDSIPFLATSFEASEKLWEVSKPALEKVLDEQNLVLLYGVPWPPQGLYTKKEINGVGDLQGVKFRSYNAATARMAELAGMLPVQIEAAELSQALATGVAESFISSGATGYDRKVWEQLTHFYEVDAWLPRNHVFVNKDSWNGLSDEQKGVFRACAALAEYAGHWRAVQYTDWTLKGLADNGMTVTKAGDKLREDLAGMGQTLTEEWLNSAGDEGKAIVDKFKSME
jgi:TRAP-type C4-dicarboxylate transport system substrate-binding protein